MGLLKWLGFDGGCESEPLELNDDNFLEEVRRSEMPVVVDVWSNGCRPCMALVPTIKRLSCKYEGKVKVAQLDAGSAPKTMRKLGVRSTPTVLFFKKGAEMERVTGIRGQHYFEEVIEGELLGMAQAQ
ncbi:MAG: thiol reductase thioredoxin [Proteobacteria bacterium]|nr:thiol reductase thioredoxin [Pseudomonadota bacterium]